MSKPAHKQDDPAKFPGQIKIEYVLSDCIDRKERAMGIITRKTFDQWFAEYNKQYGLPPAYIVAKAAWDAAKENK